MPLPTRRSYAGGAAACTLSSTINSSATSFSISGTTTGWPATAGGGFYMVIDPGLSTEEKVFVGARTSGSLSSVTRGVDGTLAASHDAGATCYPVFTSIDADQANKLASTMTTKGDLVSTDGSDPARLGVGTNNHRLVAASGETTGLKWVADTQNTVIDAKGDLLVGSGADALARLAVGTNGHAVVADSTATNGLAYAPLNGFKNVIINGNFSVNQRGFSSTTSSGTYGFDRWAFLASGGTVTYSTQSFTLGNAITGQESANFARLVSASHSAAGDYALLFQRIEGVRTFAGQDIVISFWAKASTGTPKVAVELVQGFGTGGSPSADVNTYVGQVTLSTSWVRYSVTVTVPSISGKTIGTGSNDSLSLFLWTSAGTTFNSRTGSLGVQNATIEFWGVQVEAGSVATPFERRPLQIELALCQRYYQRLAYSNAGWIAIGQVYPTNNVYATIPLPVVMRTAPTSITVSGTTYALDAGGVGRGITVAMGTSSPQILGLNATGGFNMVNGDAALLAFSTSPNYIELNGTEL